MSDFLAPAIVLGPSELGAGLPGTPPKKVSPISMICQEDQQWCWASVTQAVEDWKSNSVDQAHIASNHITPGNLLTCTLPLSVGGASCLPCGQGCGGPHYLSHVLDERGDLAAGGAQNKVVDFNDVRTSVDANKPLPLRINWSSDNSGHFICVIGYQVDGDGTQRVIVFDPLIPGVGAGSADEQSMTFDTLSTAYPSTGGATGIPNYIYLVR